MPLYLNTGTPGAGKTLYTLWTVENRRIADNKAFYDEWVKNGSHESQPPVVREVFYFNINIKKLAWIKLDKPEDWLKCPVGSIVVFDECQEAFPPRSNNTVPPLYISELAKARHAGFDLYFVTQHPTFTDPYVRKLTDTHSHLMRPFGAKKANVYQWKGVKDNCDKTRKDAIKSTFGYPKEVFEWYKSAEVHTMKFNMPFKVMLMYLLPFLIAGAAYGVYNYYDKKIHPATGTPTMVNGANAGVTQKPKYVFDAASFRPRIDDVPWSAPRYDELTAPTIAPIVVGCMVFQGICKCLTQQGTTHHATMQFCLATLENGIFQDFGNKDASSSNNQARRETGQPLQLSPPLASVVRPDSGFNLPVASVEARYGVSYTSGPSGAVYHLPSNSSKVMSKE